VINTPTIIDGILSIARGSRSISLCHHMSGQRKYPKWSSGTSTSCLCRVAEYTENAGISRTYKPVIVLRAYVIYPHLASRFLIRASKILRVASRTDGRLMRGIQHVFSIAGSESVVLFFMRRTCTVDRNYVGTSLGGCLKILAAANLEETGKNEGG